MEGITVIVCTHNGRETIAQVLAALQVQTGLEKTPLEVLVIDNVSTDDTVAVATKAWTHPTIPFRIIREEKQGVVFARQTGHRAARHDYICWVDDDNIIGPDYLARILHFMRQYPHAAVCGGFGIPLFKGEPPPWFLPEWSAFALGPQGKVDGPVSDQDNCVYGAGALLRKAALDELDAAGYSGLLIGRSKRNLIAGEDTEYCFALRLLGWQIVHSRELTFHHVLATHRLTWDYCRRLYYGFGQAEVILNLYRHFLRPDTWRNRMRLLFLNRIVRRWVRQKGEAAIRNAMPPVTEREGNHDDLRRIYIIAQGEEAARLDAAGTLWTQLEAIWKFDRHARPLRRRREAAAGFTTAPKSV